MGIQRRIFISTPADEVLDPKHRDLKACILQKIEDAGYEPQLFFLRGLPMNMPWSFNTVNEVMHRCYGAVILGLPRFSLSTDKGSLVLPTEYNHYEGAVADALDIPVLTIAHEQILDRGVFWEKAGKPILYLPENADNSWTESPNFKIRFSAWLAELSERRDVFLGYCSKAKAAAQALHLFMSQKLNLKVLNWEMDFTGGVSIIDEIERAASKCIGAIFVFSKDDHLQVGDVHQAAPRDNVVFEAGYFIRARGRERVLIVREAEAKMPADIGGIIYAAVPDLNEIWRIEGQVRDFIERRL